MVAKFLVAVLFVLAGLGQAEACLRMAQTMSGRVGPVVPVRGITALHGDVIVLTTRGEKDTHTTVHTVESEFFPELYTRLLMNKQPTYIVLTEGISKAADRGLWAMIVVAGPEQQCDAFAFGDRVFFERRNFPRDSDEAVKKWEQDQAMRKR